MCLPIQAPLNIMQIGIDREKATEQQVNVRIIQTWVAWNYEIMSHYTLSMTMLPRLVHMWEGFMSMNTVTFRSKIFPADWYQTAKVAHHIFGGFSLHFWDLSNELTHRCLFVPLNRIFNKWTLTRPGVNSFSTTGWIWCYKTGLLSI